MKEPQDILIKYCMNPKSEFERQYNSSDVFNAMEEYASQFKPEMPTDEEIVKRANDISISRQDRNGYIDGARWMRDLIAK